MTDMLVAPVVPPNHEPRHLQGAVAFSDIVASTAALEAVGDLAWLEVLLDHERTTRRVAEEHGVDVVASMGDGFVFFSADPHQLVSMGIALQRTLRAEGVPLRMGMHHGSVVGYGPNVAGLVVHIASRLTDIAQAYEIAVSEELAQCVGLPGGGRVRMIRGVSRPCRVRILKVTNEAK